MDAKRRNRWRVGKHRKKAILKFCRNYPRWKKELASGVHALDSPEYIALCRKSALVERAAREADPYISKYLVRAVTEGKPYASFWGIPCGLDYYYDRRNKMIFLINRELKEWEANDDEEVMRVVLPDTPCGDGVPEEARQDAPKTEGAKER